MDPHEALVLLVVVPTIALAVVLLIAARAWYSMRIKHWEMSLKHTMLERGMSAEEIKTVLEASSSMFTHRGGLPMMNSCGSKMERHA